MQEVILHYHICSNSACVTVSHLLGYILSNLPPLGIPLVPMAHLHSFHTHRSSSPSPLSSPLSSLTLVIPLALVARYRCCPQCPSLLVIVVALVARYLPRCWCGDPHCPILGSPCPRPCRVFCTGLGSCYPGVCRLVSIGLVSLLWGCARRMRLASLSWVSPCRR